MYIPLVNSVYPAREWNKRHYYYYYYYYYYYCYYYYKTLLHQGDTEYLKPGNTEARERRGLGVPLEL